MKKIMVLLMIMAIAMGCVFADAGSWTGDTVSGTDSYAELSVKLQLSGTNIFSIGFSDSEVTTENIDSVTPKTELSLSPNGLEYTGSTNIYYAIKNLDTTDYTISLEIGDALASSDEEKDTIEWIASATGDQKADVSSKESGTKSAPVWTVGKTANYEVGYTSLTVSTDGFAEVTNPDTTNPYFGTLKLKIASN